ncbi:MAG: methyltransferase domain-containing protein [Chitinispirillaceae bacterium]|nr:methyltransferase domain-containing protein [Chitinispirillaceae bacterium]
MTERIIITREMIEATFDGAAALYDEGKMFRNSGQRLAGLLPIQPGFRVLDIATGTGAALFPAARRTGPEGTVTSIDISAGMLEQARREAANEGLQNIVLKQMDAEHLEFPDESFDIATCAFGIFYFPRTALAEMYRVLKPGGAIGLAVFETFSPDPASPGVIVNQLIREYGEKDPTAEFARFRYAWPTRFSVEETASLLTEYGFSGITIVRETQTAVYQDIEAFWDMLLSGGSRLTFTHMDEAIRHRFKEELAERLMPVLQPDGIHLEDTAIFTVANKQ